MVDFHAYGSTLALCD